MAGVIKDHTGRRFGSLTAIKVTGEKHGRGYKWLFRCDCGNCIVNRISTVKRSAKRGSTRVLCGCKSSHGLSGHPLYKTWINLRHRCLFSNHPGYRYYGARGIKICDEWRGSFTCFVDDMMPTYSNGLTLERIDNDGDYAPDNCRWATWKEQSKNKRSNRYEMFPGYGLITIAEASECSGIHKNTICYRIKRGWPPERWLEPVNK